MRVAYGEKRALAEIQSILNAQWRNGMLPQIRFVEGQAGYSPDEEEWGVSRQISGCEQNTSGITQPPILGYALFKIYKNATNRPLMLRKLEGFYEKVKKYHDFLLRERDPDREFLVSVVHPWETGTDNAPHFDEPAGDALNFLTTHGYAQRIKKRKDTRRVASRFRPVKRDYECYGRLIDFFIQHDYNQTEIVKTSPFVVQDVLFNTIFAASVKSLSVLADEFSNEPKLSKKRVFYAEESRQNHELYKKIRRAIQDTLYDEQRGLFYSKDRVAQKSLRVDTIHCLSPLFGKCASFDQAQRIRGHLNNTERFMTDAVIPTVSREMRGNGKFEPLRYWRGPVWPVTNWIIYEGLKHYDPTEAEKLRCSTLSLIEETRQTDRRATRSWAADLMRFNSHEERYTTPSKTQYLHGWFWDSCLAAIGWIHVEDQENSTDFWAALREQLGRPGNKKSPAEVYIDLSKKMNRILFSEYFVPCRFGGYEAGTPIGAPLMTWTAALYLDMLGNCEE